MIHKKTKFRAAFAFRGVAIIIFIMLNVVIAVGQNAPPANTPRPVTLYYNQAMELTTRDKATFRRETSLDFENIVFHGLCKDYMNTTLISEGFYENGVNKGLHTEYYENGKLRSTIEYGDDGFVIWELVDAKDQHEVTHGNGKFLISCYHVESSATGQVSLNEGTVAGEFINGKRAGVWVYADKNGVTTDDEYYEGGLFKKRVAITGTRKYEETTKKNIIVSLEEIIAETFQFDATAAKSLAEYFETAGPALPGNYNRPITFPGGMKKLLLIIALGLQSDVQENVVVRITVDEKGKLQKIRSGLILSGLSDELSQILAPRASKILPAIANGNPVSMTMRIPISNSREWIEYLESVPDDDVNAYLDELNRQP